MGRALRRAGYAVIETFSPDQAVAIAVANQVLLAVLDQEFFVETDGWSVAQSLKLVRPNLSVVLISRAARLHGGPPQGVDMLLSSRQKPNTHADEIKRLLSQQGQLQRRAGAGS